MKLGLLLFALAILSPIAAPQTKTKSKPKPKLKPEAVAELAAQSAAEQWLMLIDSGKYGQSWETSAQYFQAHVTEGEWQSAAAEARGPLGMLQMRKLESAKFSKTIEGMPDGMYVVVRYDSMFEKEGSAVEDLTVMVDKDGAWRISGYFIR